MKIARWVVVANAAQARLLAHDLASDSLVLLHRMWHPVTCSPGGDSLAGRPAREAIDRSAGGNRLEPCADPRRTARLDFAREIADYLDDGHAHREFDTLCIAASSPFLGELQRELSDAVRRTLGGTADTDLTTLDLRPLLRRLRALRMPV
jgi:protein required for attachment to host cells